LLQVRDSYLGTSRGDRITAWFHERGANWGQRRRVARLLGAVSWAIWMTLLFGLHPMSRGNRVRALTRLWFWQLWRRLVRRSIVVELPEGAKVFCPPWSRLAGALAAVGFHEPEEMFFVIDLLRPGDWMVDVGANLGVYALTAARRGARVIAFEPSDAARGALEWNARLNGVQSRLHLQSVALANFNGNAHFTSGLDVGNHLIPDANSGAGESAVRVNRLDDFLKSQPGLPVGREGVLLKVDVEGFDAQVLEGAEQLIEQANPVVIVEVWAGGRSIRQWLKARGYQVYRYWVVERMLAEIPEGFAGQANFIAVHASRLAWVEDRLKTSVRPPFGRPRVYWNADRFAAREWKGEGAG